MLLGAANICRDTAKGLVKVAKEQGADPRQWYGLIGSLPLAEVVAIEVMDDEGKWVKVHDAGHAERSGPSDAPTAPNA